MTRTVTVQAIIYLRLSDLRLEDLDARGDGKTFSDRETRLRELAARLGWNVYKVIIENDVDRKTGKPRPASAFKRKKVTLPDGTTAMRVVRPGFREILDHFTARRANALLAEDLDRCFRDPRDLEDMIDISEAYKINARSLAGSLTFTDGGTDAEITMARVMVTLGNKSSRDTSRRVADGRDRKANSGQFGGGGRRRFGFERDGVTKVPAECEIVKEYSELVLQLDEQTGELRSLRTLAAELRAGDVPTVSGHPWTAESLRSILLRPRNAGILVHRGQEHGKAPWEPIVEVETFRAVQRLLTDPARRTGPGATPRWLGSGVYRCGICADGTRTKIHHGNAKGGSKERRARYVCKSGTTHIARGAVRVDAYVQATIVNRLSQPGFVEQFLRKPDMPEVDAAALRAEATSIRINLDGLAEDRALGLIDRAQMLKATKRGKARLDEINRTLAEVATGSPLSAFVGVEDVGETWLAQPLSTRRAIVDKLATVTLHKSLPLGPRFDTSTVEIRFNAPERVEMAA